jgi:hypothetical protein
MMFKRLIQRGGLAAGALAVLGSLFTGAPSSSAAPFDGRRDQFADSGFRTVWTRTDAPNVRGGRSWVWGPQPWFDYSEFYRQGTNGLRQVQYFDKARMEINHPDDRSFQQGVSNGLLVVELVSGQLKLGDEPADNAARASADVPVAGNPKGDNPNAPTYANFQRVATLNNGYRDPSRLGQRVSATLDRSGNLGTRGELASAETEIAQYNSVTGHNIPRVFWDYLNLQGAYNDGGATRTGPVVDWLFAMGLPISDPYWIRAKIGAQEKDVLVQLFERRVLTYVADNPAGYKVEMGNVGQHYFQWRYPHLGQPWASPAPNPPLLFATDASSPGVFQVALWEFGANTWAPLTSEPQESVAFSYRRSFDPAQTRVLIDSRRSDKERRRIYELNAPELYVPAPGQRSARKLDFIAGAYPGPSGDPSGYDDYNPSYSPDGTKIVFASTRDAQAQLYIASLDQATLRAERIAQLAGTQRGCLLQVPTWSPDGRTLYWEQQCSGGKFAVMRGDLKYEDDQPGVRVAATLVNVRALTDQSGDNRYPRVSPDGTKITFTSYRDGNAEIYVMLSNGANQTRLTNSPTDDEAATWRADGRQLAFASNRDGNFELYTMNADGSGQTRLTNSPSQDRWPMWAQ